MVGNILIAVSIIFTLAETAYFGWNWVPESAKEWIADGIGVLIFLAGISVRCYHHA
jgi:hypothetical protein